VVSNGNTVSAETKDSSSAGNSVPTDKHYCWPPQNDSIGGKQVNLTRGNEGFFIGNDCLPNNNY